MKVFKNVIQEYSTHSFWFRIMINTFYEVELFRENFLLQMG